eukprot:13176853-Alexandrium_andersonii.AAC.1
MPPTSYYCREPRSPGPDLPTHTHTHAQRNLSINPTAKAATALSSSSAEPEKRPEFHAEGGSGPKQASGVRRPCPALGIGGRRRCPEVSAPRASAAVPLAAAP